ncbi:reverse transcriptase domain-containing protein [Tanacetum coccineum]
MSGGLRRGTSGDDIRATPSGSPKISSEPLPAESLLKITSLAKEHNSRGNISPIHLSFDDGEDRTRVRTVVTGKEIVGADLKRPFKEAVKTPLTQRIIEFAGPEFKKPTNIKLYDETTDPEDHLSRFLSAENSSEWPMPVWCRMFQQTLDGSTRGWFENLSMGSIASSLQLGVPEVMKISSFMDAHKCPELAKRYSDKVPKTVDEMMTWLDDFVRSEEAFASTELPKGEASEAFKKSTRPVSRREDRFHRGGYGVNLQPPRPMQLPPKKENQDKYCDYHGEKGHYTNDYFQLRRQLEMALESGKLNHLIKDVRQRGQRNTKGRDTGKDMVINMVRSWPDDRKRKSVERDESWMKAPIVFPPLSMKDASDEPLIIEAVMKEYLVCRVYVDQGASVEVMFEHCFENLCPAMRSRLRSTQMDLVGFAGGVVKLLGKIELEVVFGNGGLFRRVMISFTVVRDPSPYNVILGRMGLRTLQAVSSTIHSMEARKKQMIKSETHKNTNPYEEDTERVDLTEQTLVSPSYPDQLVTIRGNLFEECKNQLKALLKKSMDVFMCESSDMIGPRWRSRNRNLEAYVDDMVIKSNDEKVLIADIAETFDNLRRINMKLNPKKCSFAVKEGKFLGYMVASIGIQANSKKTKAIADMQLPRTLREMQSLSGKLAALKSNRGGRKCGASGKERETLPNTLRGYEDLGTYNRTYEPRNAIKGQFMSDFLSEASVGTLLEAFFRLPARVQSNDDVERWNLFTDGESNSKGSGASFVLISPSGAEFKYALQLNFTSTNNKAEYEALLAGLCMALKMKVRDIDVKVDSKLVASQINESYVASSTSMIKYLTAIRECIAAFKRRDRRGGRRQLDDSNHTVPGRGDMAGG